MQSESIAEFVAIPIGRGCGDGDMLYGNGRGDGGGYGDGLANGDNLGAKRCDGYGDGVQTFTGWGYGDGDGDGGSRGDGTGFDTELTQP